jgi:hypothetical protein
MPTRYFIGTLLLSIFTPLAAQEAEINRADKHIIAARTDVTPVIDGILNDETWSQATVIEDIHQIRPFEYEAPTQRTRFYLAYDSDNIYIAMRAWDTHPGGPIARIMRQGAIIDTDDRIGIIFDTFNDNRNGFQFELNPHGVRQDGLFKNVSQYAREWDGIWAGNAQILDDGWTAEIAIPLKTLPFNPNSDTWGINFWRAYQRNQETMGWSSYNRATNPSSTGTVSGLFDLQQGLGLDVTPSAVASAARNYDTDTDETNFEPSLDASYRLTPSLNAALTINTDFSATEVDSRQITLSRFNLFFPEKREFFLRDGDIFEFGRIGAPPGATFNNADNENGRPFFSRRIGLGPQGEPIDLKVGGKLSGRAGNWNIGALAVKQGATEDLDASDLFVARISRNVLDESTIGAILTKGDPLSNKDNSLVGVDFLYNNTRLGNGRTLAAEAWYQRSDTEADEGDESAWGIGIEMPNSRGWAGKARFRRFGEKYNPALGFSSRKGVYEYLTEVQYVRVLSDHYLREIKSRVDYKRYERISGGVQTESYGWEVFSLRNQAGDFVAVRIPGFRQGLVRDFEISEGVVLKPGNYEFTRYGIRFNSATQRALSIAGWFFGGEYWSGTRDSYSFRLVWRPSPHILLSTSYDYNDIRLPEGDFETSLVNVRFEGVFSSSWSWVNIIQYDNVTDSIGINSRLHWTPQAGRDVYLVLNHNMVEDDEEDGNFNPVATDLSFKVNYTFRF